MLLWLVWLLSDASASRCCHTFPTSCDLTRHAFTVTSIHTSPLPFTIDNQLESGGKPFIIDKNVTNFTLKADVEITCTSSTRETKFIFFNVDRFFAVWVSKEVPNSRVTVEEDLSTFSRPSLSWTFPNHYTSYRNRYAQCQQFISASHGNWTEDVTSCNHDWGGSCSDEWTTLDIQLCLGITHGGICLDDMTPLGTFTAFVGYESVVGDDLSKFHEPVALFSMEDHKGCQGELLKWGQASSLRFSLSLAALLLASG